MTKTMFVVLSLVFLIFSLLPSIYEVSQSGKIQSNRTFELIHNYYTDYNFYLSRIRQGIEGRITAIEKYTSEPHKGSFIQVFYLFLGWTGKLVHIPPNQAGYPYHTARIVLGGTLIFFISYIAKKLFSSLFWQVIAFFLIMTASSWPTSVSSQAFYRIQPFMSWWTVMDPLARIAFIPHILTAQIFVLVLLFFLSDRSVMVRPGNWFFFGVLGLLLGFIFPPALMLVYAGLASSFVLHGLFGARMKKDTALEQYALALLVFFLVSVPSLVYFQIMLSFSPWKRLMDFYIVRPPMFPFIEYIKAVGPVLPMGMLGAILVFIKREKQMIAAVSWTIAWVILLFVFSFIKQTSPLRATELAPHIPLGILSAYFCYSLYSYSIAYYQKSKRFSSSRNLLRMFSLALPIGIIIMGFFLMYNSFLAQRNFIDQKVRAAYPLISSNNTIMYPVKDFMDAIYYLESKTTSESIVLSELTAGNYIPAYSGNTVYAGQDNTVNAEEKMIQAAHFFSGTMDEQHAKQWLVSERIQYIFYGPQEREDGGPTDLRSVYPFLDEWYKNTSVFIYSVNNL